MRENYDACFEHVLGSEAASRIIRTTVARRADFRISEGSA
jgi:hypothetical protein